MEKGKTFMLLFLSAILIVSGLLLVKDPMALTDARTPLTAREIKFSRTLALFIMLIGMTAAMVVRPKWKQVSKNTSIAILAMFLSGILGCILTLLVQDVAAVPLSDFSLWIIFSLTTISFLCWSLRILFKTKEITN